MPAMKSATVQPLRPTISRVLHLVVAALVVLLWVRTAASPGSASERFVYVFGVYPVDQFAWNVAATYAAGLLLYVVGSHQDVRRRLIVATLHLSGILLPLALVEGPALVGWIDYREYLAPDQLGGEGPGNRLYEPELYFHRPPHDRFSNALYGDAAAILGMRSAPRYAADYRYDHSGFRNDHDLDSAAVVLVGDSFVEGYKVTQERIVSMQLGALLGTRVANLGQSDFGPPNELAVLRLVGLPLQPAVVVWFFFEGNDLYDYDLERAGWSTRGATFSDRSFVLNGLRVVAYWTRRHRDADDPQIASAMLRGPIKEAGATMYFENTNPPIPSTSTLSQLDEFTRIVGQARSLCEAQGVQFLLAVVPIKARVYAPWASLPSALADRLVQGDISRRIASWAQANGIHLLDLEQPLRAAAPRGAVYYLDDAHWTGFGHRVVAESVAAFIRERHWLP